MRSSSTRVGRWRRCLPISRLSVPTSESPTVAHVRIRHGGAQARGDAPAGGGDLLAVEHAEAVHLGVVHAAVERAQHVDLLEQTRRRRRGTRCGTRRRAGASTLERAIVEGVEVGAQVRPWQASSRAPCQEIQAGSSLTRSIQVSAVSRSVSSGVASKPSWPGALLVDARAARPGSAARAFQLGSALPRGRRSPPRIASSPSSCRRRERMRARSSRQRRARPRAGPRSSADGRRGRAKLPPCPRTRCRTPAGGPCIRSLDLGRATTCPAHEVGDVLPRARARPCAVVGREQGLARAAPTPPAEEEAAGARAPAPGPPCRDRRRSRS